MRKYSRFNNFLYVYKEMYKFDKKLFIFMGLFILAGICLPLFGAIVPSLVIQYIQQNVELKQLTCKIIFVFLIFGGINYIYTYLKSYEQMMFIQYRNVHYWTMAIHCRCEDDYQKNESQENKEARSKAYQSINNNSNGVEGVCHDTSLLFTGILGLFVYICILGNINFQFVCILVALSLLSFFIYLYANKKYQSYKEDIAKNYVHLDYYSKIAFSQQSGKDIRLFHLFPLLMNEYERITRIRILLTSKQEKSLNIYYYFVELMNLIRDYACYKYLIDLLLDNQITISGFVLYLGIVSGISSLLMQIAENFGNISKNCDYVDDLRKYLDSCQDEKATKKYEEVGSFEIECKNVSFKYPNGDRYILEHFNLHIKKNEKIGLVGMNGAGKSTLVKLLCGFYHPTSGQILINGVDIETIQKESYYEHLGVVFQDSILYSCTIGENITGEIEGTYDEKRVMDCIEKAGMKEYVESLPKGIHQYIGKDIASDGINVSGGQKQKLFLARVLYKNPDALFMDEPTAALDALSEKDLYEQFNELAQNKTCIFISHRLASTKFCDRIILLKDGKIIEEGTHDELMKLKKEYYELFEVQSKYYREEGGKDETTIEENERLLASI